MDKEMILMPKVPTDEMLEKRDFRQETKVAIAQYKAMTKDAPTVEEMDVAVIIEKLEYAIMDYGNSANLIQGVINQLKHGKIYTVKVQEGKQNDK